MKRIRYIYEEVREFQGKVNKNISDLSVLR